MSKRCIIFSALLMLVLAAGPSLAAESTTGDNASPGSESLANADETGPAKEVTASPEVESQDEESAVANLQYIWSLTGIEGDQITMVLNQTGKDLSGAAKYEGSDPWNALVMGSVSGDEVDLVMTAMKGTEMVMTKMSGAFSGDTITGTFTQTDMTGNAKKSGEFSAIWINPDTSAYTPAVITGAKPAASAVQSQASEVAPEPAGTPSESEATGPAVLGSGSSDEKPKGVQLGGKVEYVDVHKYKHQYEIGGDLSGVPPGMGGGSL